tara:strand:+ start:564 stop:1616 length:1053 start_codon:yes stop_codon:yes gene_type:complete
MRELTTIEAIREATDIGLEKYPEAFLIGEGVPDPKRIFGTTKDLKEKYPNRVFDMPLSENALTGVCIGAAISGSKPILVHQRIDFSLLSLDQVINNAAKWYSMFGNQKSVPLVIRMIIGRGWGQGAQHSQNLQAIFSHIPGLKVVMPSTPYDSKGLLLASLEDKNPVIFLEHRWLQNLTGDVPEGYYTSPLGKSSVSREGEDITIVATSFSVIESLKAAKELEKVGIKVEVIDVKTLNPIDTETILDSVKKTGKLLVYDLGWKSCGFAAEIIALVSEKIQLKSLPQRITCPDLITPSSHGLIKYFYPTYITLIKKTLDMCGVEDTITSELIEKQKEIPLDVPDLSFKGPF